MIEILMVTYDIHSGKTLTCIDIFPPLLSQSLDCFIVRPNLVYSGSDLQYLFAWFSRQDLTVRIYCMSSPWSTICCITLFSVFALKIYVTATTEVVGHLLH